ncbi:uncharacterized protein LOC143298812 isoform X2 [Babylonia areolata]|uniref:uncharacterized protein LOC143298812 isoform X2 n=1 Tax=Babylonia areolata TaxID=304850 RepID=UPI003FD0152F
MADPRLPPLPAGGTGQGLRMERCILNKEQVMLPEAFNSQTNIFEHVMSVDTWNNVLDEEERKRLKALLPTFPEDDEAEKDETVRRLFNGDNFKFGNPLQQFHKKLKDGLLSPDIAKCNRMCRKFKKREYKFTQQKYLSNLVSEIIVSRERTLHLRNGQPPDKVLPFRSVPKPERNKDMKDRVEKNYHRILKEAREECNLEDTSSEEEESINTVQRSKRQLHRSLGPIPSPEPTTPSVVATFASKPSTLNGDISGNANKRPRALSPVEITDDHYRQMLKRHKRRKLEEPNIPELNTTEVTLQDILNRCQASKKTNKTSPVVTANGDAGQEVEVPVAALAAVAGASPVTTTPAPTTTPTATGKKKPQPRVPRVKTEKKIKRKVKSEKEEMEEVGDVSLTLQPAATNLDVHSDLLTHRDDGVPDFPLVDALPARLSMGQADNFFSLLRDIICDFPDSKATTAKVEERVREWQESPAISLNSWVHTENWVELVISALKFLSGDVLGLSVENFVPFLDYKERAQQWKWIGAGRDSNQQLSPLFRHWLKHKNSLPVDSLNSTQGSPPPVRTKTSFVVRPTLPTEKALYREQERRRFDNPHRAFTYHLHGYDSVVGPVKGVYNKENAITKAREHNLLISDRPAYVTILTLVRDAAARLPNGEGTRGDICELLKDSQFLSPGVTDTQINTVVSGALDRLHSEKDPCVKYDVNSKLWIYLHRSRTEEEFERIHQAQGAAAKAKKSLQRPKTSKIKDHMSQSTAASVKAALAQNVASAAAVASGSGDLPLDPITPLVTAPTSLTQPPTKVLTAAEATLQQVRNGKGKQMTAAKAAAAAAVASANSMAIVTTTPQQATTTNVPGATSALTKPAASKGRAPVVNVTASGTPSLLGPRTQSPAHTAQQSPSILASLGKGGVASVAGGISVTKAPVVTVTKQGLTPGARPGGNTGGQQVFRSTAAATTQSAAEIILGSSGPAPQSPIILTQDPSSRSSTPTAVTVNTPPPSAKLVTLAQPASAGMVVTGATPPATAAKLVTLAQTGGTTVGGGVVVTGAGSDGAMITRLVQQVAGGAQQVVNVSSLPAKGLPQASGQQRSTTLKIQGGSIVQPIVGGKPVALSGKPLLQFGKGGQPLGVIQTSQGQISTLSLIPQPAPSTAQASSASHSPSANASKITVAAAASKSSSGSSSPVTLTMVASGGTTLPKASILASTGASTLPAQAKVVTPSQAGMVVTQLAPGLSLRPAGLTAASQAKVVTGGQAGLVPTQFIVQQAPPPSASQATAQGTPLMVSQAGGKGGQQNIQVVRTVLSPQGLKPGQATILISQPALQQAAAAATGSVISSAQVIHTAGASAPGVGKASGRGSPKGKAQPVYARIITPPPGMKLTTVGPNQVQATGGNVNMLQTVGKLLAGLPTAATAASTGGATVTIPTSSPSPAVVVATAQNTASGQSLLKSQPSDTSDASNSDAQS